MKPSIFVSYSRREVPFVNHLVADLEEDDFDVWLDFRSLIPGSPWDTQIDAAIDQAEVVLIVVSKASAESQYVLEEVERVFSIGKRMVLVVFEAAELPDALEKCEWVDFRGNYKDGLQQLKALLQHPASESIIHYETGFKAPAMVWLAVVLSVVVAFFSLPAAWTIWLPLMLIPLPYRIIKRDFNFNQVQAALLLLPFAIYFTNLAVSDAVWEYTQDMEWLSIAPVVGLFFLLRSPTLQRWGKPVATMPRFANPHDPDIQTPVPTPFYMDHALEDQYVADEMIAVLERYGHPRTEIIEEAEVVLALVSDFKCDTAADPQKQVVYPIILQTTDKEISQNLQRIQWIDYRAGVRNLDELAQLLPEPERLLKALALRPMGRQLILPRPVKFTMYFWGMLAMFNAGACLPYVIQYSDEILADPWALPSLLLVFVLLGGFGALAYFAVRQLIARKKGLSSWWGVLGVTVLMGVILYAQSDLVWVFETTLGIDWDNEFRGISAELPLMLYWAGNGVLLLYLLWKWKDMTRWFPKSKNLFKRFSSR